MYIYLFFSLHRQMFWFNLNYQYWERDILLYFVSGILQWTKKIPLILIIKFWLWLLVHIGGIKLFHNCLFPSWIDVPPLLFEMIKDSYILISMKLYSSNSNTNNIHKHYIKVTGWLSVCVYRMISLIAEPIWFFVTVKLLIGPGRLITILREGTSTFPRKTKV